MSFPQTALLASQPSTHSSICRTVSFRISCARSARGCGRVVCWWPRMAWADAGTVEPEWLGVPMYFSGYAAEDSREFLVVAGLEIETFQYETILEQGRPTRFLWVVARKTRES